MTTTNNAKQVYDLQRQGYSVKGQSPTGQVLMHRPATWRWSLLDVILVIFTLGLWLFVVLGLATTRRERTIVVEADGSYPPVSDAWALVAIVALGALASAVMALTGVGLLALGVALVAWFGFYAAVNSQ